MSGMPSVAKRPSSRRPVGDAAWSAGARSRSSPACGLAPTNIPRRAGATPVTASAAASAATPTADTPSWTARVMSLIRLRSAMNRRARKSGTGPG